MDSTNLSAGMVAHAEAACAAVPIDKLAEGDMPRDLANAMHHQLLDVLTLLTAARRQVDNIGEEGDFDGMTDGDSRAVALCVMADEKVRGIIVAISPYV